MNEQNVIKGIYQTQAQLFKLLSHPARLEILMVLRDTEACVCHLEAALGYRQAYISQQLSVLREAGLVEDRKEGWNSFYRVKDKTLFDVIDTTARFTGFTPGTHEIVLTDCPCPHCRSE